MPKLSLRQPYPQALLATFGHVCTEFRHLPELDAGNPAATNIPPSCGFPSLFGASDQGRVCTCACA